MTYYNSSGVRIGGSKTNNNRTDYYNSNNKRVGSSDKSGNAEQYQRN